MYHNRFKRDFPLAALYNELREGLGRESAAGETVAVKDLYLDLPSNKIIVNGVEKTLGARARSTICDRLSLGRPWEVYSPERLADLTEDINAHMKRSSSTLTLKSRGDEVQGVVSDGYQETPYDSILTMLEHLGARPIRVYQNNFNLRLQALFEEYVVEPRDGESTSLGIQLSTSDMGVGALAFDVFTYRYICENGCVMGKRTVGTFRVVHIHNQDQLDKDTKEEVHRVLSSARKELVRLSDNLIKMPYDQALYVGVVGREAFGKKVMAEVSAKIRAIQPKSMYDVYNVLTEAGHNPDYSLSIQHLFETTAGKLMGMAA